MTSLPLTGRSALMVAACCGAILIPGKGWSQGVRPTVATIEPARASVMGVSLDLSRHEVLQVLGQPLRRSRPEVDDLIGDTVRVWTYSAARLAFYGDKLQEVHCTGRACATRDGVRVGDPLARLIEVYGRPEEMGKGAEHSYWYEIGQSDCSMSFLTRKSVIVEIRLDCDYS